MAEPIDGKEYIQELKTFLETDADGMTDDQLLTLLLSYTDCRKNTVAVSSGLLKHFGSFEACFDASYDDLLCADGMTRNAALLISLVSEMRRACRKRYKVGKRVDDIETFFLGVVRQSSCEESYVAAFDSKNKLLGVERLAAGNSCSVDFFTNDIVDFAAFHKADKIAVAHNHPGVNTTEASQHDFCAIKSVGEILQSVGVEFIGQVIVAGDEAKLYSFK